MTDEDLINAIDAAEATAYGGPHNSEIGEARAKALRMYLGENINPAPAGRSQIVSRDVFDTVETMRPAIQKIFASGDEVVKCMPIGPEDEQLAQQESAYLNHVVTELNDWPSIVNDVTSDALISKMGYILAYWDETKSTDKETYHAQSPDAVALLAADPEVEILETTQELGEDGQPEITVKLARTKESGQVKICVLPPERTKVSERTPDHTLRDCPYFEYWEMKSLSYIRQMGFDIPDDIADDSGDYDSDEDYARDRYGESVTRDGELADPSSRLVNLRMVWIRFDADGDGIAEMLYVLRVGETILYKEECSRIPVASLCPIPLPHRHIGLSIADVVEDIQESKTAMIRQGLDNLYQSNNMRMFASPAINLDDLLTNVPGGIVRGREGAMMGQDLAPIVVPQVFQQAMQGLEYLDSVRQNRTGTNAYFAGTDANAINKTATGIAQLSSQASQRVEQVARMLAIGFAQLMSVTHELILKHGHKAQVFPLRGQWVTADPRQWRRRTDIRLSVGLGTGNKEAVLGHLNMLLQKQLQALPMRVTTPKHIYQTLAEMVKTMGFPNADKFFIDPDKLPPPGPPPPDPLIVKTQMETQARGQLGQIQGQIDVKRLELDALKEHERVMLDKYKIDTDAAVKLQIEQIKQDAAASMTQASQSFEQQKIGMQYEREDQAAQRGQEGEAMLNEYMARAQQVQQALEEVLATITAPQPPQQQPIQQPMPQGPMP